MPLTNTPRVSLGTFPTPLQELPNLSRALGGPRILIKREDLTGHAMGGNKTRQVERLLAYAQSIGANAVVTASSSQSNYCLQIAAGARKLGMEVGLVQYSGQHPEMQGNMLLQRIVGSRVKVLEGDISSPSYLEHRDEEFQKLAREFRARGREPWVTDFNFPSPYFRLCASGWVDGAEEVCHQLADRGIDSGYIVVAVSSGCTAAGLVLGCRLMKSRLKVIGMAASRTLEIARDKIVDTANYTAEFIGAGVRFTADDLIMHDAIGRGYGLVYPECLEAIRLMARTEGIFLDPVYTGKALAGLAKLVRTGELGQKDTVVFLHTGGTPALFAYHSELASGSDV